MHYICKCVYMYTQCILRAKQKKNLSFSQGFVAECSFPVVFWSFCPLPSFLLISPAST